MGSVGPFATSAIPPSAFTATILLDLASVNPLAQVVGNDATLQSAGITAPGPAVLLLRGNMPSFPSGDGAWRLSFQIPDGLAPGVYEAEITLDLYTGDPP
jgi:hypothetical protein